VLDGLEQVGAFYPVSPLPLYAPSSSSRPFVFCFRPWSLSRVTCGLLGLWSFFLGAPWCFRRFVRRRWSSFICVSRVATLSQFRVLGCPLLFGPASPRGVRAATRLSRWPEPPGFLGVRFPARCFPSIYSPLAFDYSDIP